jgi:phosphotransferase system HPr (HPr) family protein
MLRNGFTRVVRLRNPEGLDLLAASALSQRARQYPCVIRVWYKSRWADAKNIWELLTLVAEPHGDLILEAEGPKSDEATQSLADLVEDQFDVEANDRGAP